MKATCVRLAGHPEGPVKRRTEPPRPRPRPHAPHPPSSCTTATAACRGYAGAAQGCAPSRRHRGCIHVCIHTTPVSLCLWYRVMAHVATHLTCGNLRRAPSALPGGPHCSGFSPEGHIDSSSRPSLQTGCVMSGGNNQSSTISNQTINQSIINHGTTPAPPLTPASHPIHTPHSFSPWRP